MAFMPALLRRIFKPVFSPMDSKIEPDRIGHDLEVAIDEHERAGQAERESYDQRLNATIDDLLRKIGRAPERDGRGNG